MSARTYTGWKAALLAIGACAIVYTALNLLARSTRTEPRPTPTPTVITVTATPR